MAVADRAAAVQRLPGHSDQDPYQRLALAFLVAYPHHSARAYLADLKAWASWCAVVGVHPFDARRHHVDAWIRLLTTTPLPRTGRPLASSSMARRLSALSAFYDYGIGVDVLAFSPVANVRRPKVSEDSTTVGLSAAELVTLLDVADAHSTRSGALVSLLAYNGVRINEALTADLIDYTYQRGHRVLRITRKGGKTSTEPLAPPQRCGPSTPTSTTTTPWAARCSSTGPTALAFPTRPRSTRSDAWPVRQASQHGSRSPPTRCATASSPKPSPLACHYKTFKTPPATPTPEPPGVTTAAATTSTATPPTYSPPTYAGPSPGLAQA